MERAVELDTGGVLTLQGLAVESAGAWTRIGATLWTDFPSQVQFAALHRSRRYFSVSASRFRRWAFRAMIAMARRSRFRSRAAEAFLMGLASAGCAARQHAVSYSRIDSVAR